VTRELVRRFVPLPRVVKRASTAVPSTAAFVGVALLTHSPVYATPTSTVRDQAVVHFNEGNEAFSRGDTHEAYKQYQTAWELHPTFDIACNLGRAEAELGKLPQAALHLSYCLEHFSSSPQQDLRDARQRYSDLFDTVRTQVSGLKFVVEPNGAAVFVNGANVGTTPLDHEVFVLPGTQVVELKVEGYQDLKREIPAFAGESRSLELRLERLGPALAPGAAPPAAPAAEADGEMRERGASTSDPGVSTRSIALVSGAVLTAAGAGVGLGFYLQGAKLDDEASVLRDRIQTAGAPDPNPCATASTPECTQLADTLDSRNQAWTISTVGFVSMGVFGLGTLATWLWWPAASTSSPSTSSPSAHVLTIVPVVTGQHWGAGISGTL